MTMSTLSRATNSLNGCVTPYRNRNTSSFRIHKPVTVKCLLVFLLPSICVCTENGTLKRAVASAKVSTVWTRAALAPYLTGEAANQRLPLLRQILRRLLLPWTMADAATQVLLDSRRSQDVLPTINAPSERWLVLNFLAQPVVRLMKVFRLATLIMLLPAMLRAVRILPLLRPLYRLHHPSLQQLHLLFPRLLLSHRLLLQSS